MALYGVRSASALPEGARHPEPLKMCEEGDPFPRGFPELGPEFRSKTAVLHEHSGPWPRKDGRLGYLCREQFLSCNRISCSLETVTST